MWNSWPPGSLTLEKGKGRDREGGRGGEVLPHVSRQARLPSTLFLPAKVPTLGPAFSWHLPQLFYLVAGGGGVAAPAGLLYPSPPARRRAGVGWALQSGSLFKRKNV